MIKALFSSFNTKEMLMIKYQLWAIFLVTLTAFPSGLWAANNPDSSFDIRLSGFGTAGITRSDNDLQGFRRDLSRKGASKDKWEFGTDSLLGLQLDLRLTEHLSGAIQLVAKDRTNNSLSDSVEWAYARFQASPSITLRAGRMGFDVFLLSEYRNLGFAYLWVRPPIEFYGALAFDYVDGIDMIHSTPLGTGTLRTKILAGVTKNHFESGATGSVTEIDITPVLSANLSWENNHWRTQLGAAYLKIDSSLESNEQLASALQQVEFLWPGVNDITKTLETKERHLRYISGGAAYENDTWVLQSELGYINTDLEQFTSLASAYFSTGYKIGSTTLFAVGAIAKNTTSQQQLSSAPPIPDLQLLQQQVQISYDLNRIKQHTLSLGVRWDVRHNMALKTQWDHTWVDKYGGGLFYQKTPYPSKQELNTLSINLDFIF